MSRAFFTLSLFLLLHLAVAEIIKVPEDHATIQAGIDAAVAGDTVLVADSTWFENIDFKGKAITVASYFLMDGDTGHIDSTIINGSQPQEAGKGSVVSFVSGEDTTSILCGFTITGGTGTVYDIMHKVGGGVYCQDSGSRIAHNKIVHNSVSYMQICLGGGIGSYPIQNLKHVVIEENVIESNSLYAQDGSSGGGIFLPQGKIFNNKISHNFNSGEVSFGGGIALYCDTTNARTLVKIIGNTITNNQATATSPDYGGIGGGIDIQYCNVLLLNNLITYNTLSGDQPEGGAGVRLILSTGPSLVKNNIISFNSSILWGYGGGIEAYETVGLTIQDNQFEGNENALGGGIAINSTRGTVISGNIFQNNHSIVGGGVYEEFAVSTVISGNKFIGNRADYHGAGIMITESSPGVYNNLIINNKALFNGGGIYVGDQNSEARIINNTIVADTAGLYGGGICANEVSPVILNTIIWGNKAQSGKQLYTIGGDTRVAYCDIQDTLWTGEGNISTDPQLVDDSLANSSPCISAGVLSYDFGDGIICHCPSEGINGTPRPSPENTRPDMGAWESLEGIITNISNTLSIFPESFLLEQNYPNPFNNATMINYQLSRVSEVELTIYNLLGQKMTTLVSKRQPAGTYTVHWDAGEFATGVYFYRIQAGKFVATRKCLLLK